MNEQLESALDKILAANPGPSTHPTSDRLILDLENYYATSAGFTGFSAMPAELGQVDWHDLVKPSTRRAILTHVEILPADKLAELKKLAAEHAATITDQISYSPMAANKAHEDQRTDLHQTARNRSAEIDSKVLHSRESLQADFVEKRKALDQRLALIAQEAFPICKFAIHNIETALQDELRSSETGERAVAEAYDLPWIPSSVWKACAVNLIVARKNILLFAGRADQGPAQIMAGFINLY
ncbi:MAG TPA: hypothetical protein VG347_24820 [Verrucomicrobiae bacterium]|nr:hypothetical protein [Verrucomicrobiae bacterium]